MKYIIIAAIFSVSIFFTSCQQMPQKEIKNIGVTNDTISAMYIDTKNDHIWFFGDKYHYKYRSLRAVYGLKGDEYSNSQLMRYFSLINNMITIDNHKKTTINGITRAKIMTLDAITIKKLEDEWFKKDQKGYSETLKYYKDKEPITKLNGDMYRRFHIHGDYVLATSNQRHVMATSITPFKIYINELEVNYPSDLDSALFGLGALPIIIYSEIFE